MEPGIQNENFNNFNWKDKLEDMDNLSGEMFTDKNAAWEKLHDRLHKKSSRIKSVWFWLAAACLLPVLLIPLLTINKGPGVIAKNGIVKPVSKIPAAPPVLLEKEITKVVITASVKEKRQMKTAGELSNSKKFSADNDVVKDSNTITVIDVKKNIPQNQEISPEIVLYNSFTAVPVVAVAKKKLKVVHINELGDPVEEMPYITRIAYNRAAQSRFINRQVFMSPSHTSYATGFNIFKTKNTPPN